jgi:hypothetical protein
MFRFFCRTLQPKDTTPKPSSYIYCGASYHYDNGTMVDTTKGWKPIPGRLDQLGKLEICSVCNKQLACLEVQNGPVALTIDQVPTIPYHPERHHGKYKPRLVVLP